MADAFNTFANTVSEISNVTSVSGALKVSGGATMIEGSEKKYLIFVLPPLIVKNLSASNSSSASVAKDMTPKNSFKS